MTGIALADKRRDRLSAEAGVTGAARSCEPAPRAPFGVATTLLRCSPEHSIQEVTMSKTGRKRRARKKKAANHGKRPNA